MNLGGKRIQDSVNTTIEQIQFNNINVKASVGHSAFAMGGNDWIVPVINDIVNRYPKSVLNSLVPKLETFLAQKLLTTTNNIMQNVTYNVTYTLLNSVN